VLTDSCGNVYVGPLQSLKSILTSVSPDLWEILHKDGNYFSARGFMSSEMLNAMPTTEQLPTVWRIVVLSYSTRLNL
jgi:hypothetical protein